MITFNLANRVQVVNKNPNIDADYGPYVDVTAACTAVPFRSEGKTVGIITPDGIVEYWWKVGTDNNQLIIKNVSASTVDLSLYSTTSQANLLYKPIDYSFALNGITNDSPGNLTESSSYNWLINQDGSAVFNQGITGYYYDRIYSLTSTGVNGVYTTTSIDSDNNTNYNNNTFNLSQTSVGGSYYDVDGNQNYYSLSGGTMQGNRTESRGYSFISLDGGSSTMASYYDGFYNYTSVAGGFFAGSFTRPDGTGNYYEIGAAGLKLKTNNIII